MARTLMTSWSEHAAAALATLAAGRQRIDIFERDLLRIGLDRADTLSRLYQGLSAMAGAQIRIVVPTFEPIRQHLPRFMAFFEYCSHRVEIRRLPEHLAHLADAMVLADARHATVRFQHDQPRSVAIVDDLEATAPFQTRFDALWNESTESMGSRTLGL